MAVDAHCATRYLQALIASSTILFVLCGAVAAQMVGWVATRRGQAGKDLNAVYFVDTKRGWIAGDGGFISHTEDGGNSWTQQQVATADAINDVYFRNKEDGYLLAGNKIFSTDNGGATWTELKQFIAADFGGAQPELYSVRFANKKKGWIVGSLSRRDRVVDSLIFYTNNGGASWQRQRSGNTSELIHIDFASDKRGYVVGAGGTILFTRDGGETWTKQRSGVTTTLYHVDFRSERLGLVVGERGTILRTTDGGETWTQVNWPARGTLLSVQFTSDNECWIVGRGGVILRSSDGGRTWARQPINTTQNLYAFYADKKTCWAVGGDGIVLRYER